MTEGLEHIFECRKKIRRRRRETKDIIEPDETTAIQERREDRGHCRLEVRDGVSNALGNSCRDVNGAVGHDGEVFLAIGVNRELPIALEHVEREETGAAGEVVVQCFDMWHGPRDGDGDLVYSTVVDSGPERAVGFANGV